MVSEDASGTKFLRIIPADHGVMAAAPRRFRHARRSSAQQQLDSVGPGDRFFSRAPLQTEARPPQLAPPWRHPAQHSNKAMNSIINHESPASSSLEERWQAVSQPGSHETEGCFARFLGGPNRNRTILNCAIPITRALELTRFSLPSGVTAADCLASSVTGRFPDALRDWSYTPKIQAVPQLPYMHPLPREYASLKSVPWFQHASPAGWLGINARHLRYHHELFRDINPHVLQGVQTTLVLAMPQLGFCLTPHIQTEKAFLFFASLARGLCAVQLFPGKFIYPGANLGELADMPTPMLPDILPATGGFAYPTVESEPDPWRVLAHYHRTDRYYGYPFGRVVDANNDFAMNDYERGAMLLPDGCRASARHGQSYVYARRDPELNRELQLSRQEFAQRFCLLRGAVTHDGLPFNLPVAMQPMVYAIVLTHWTLLLDEPGNLDSYTVLTEHAAIRGFNYYQKIEPFHTSFMRLMRKLGKDQDFRSYPLATHLTDSWLGGNLQISDQISQSERDLGPNLMRAYYHQQLDFQLGIYNVMNQASFWSRQTRAGRIALTGQEIEKQLDFDALAFHTMHRLLRHDSHLFAKPTLPASTWPNLHPGWTELDRHLRTESLPKI
jgi:hypothetical protein